MSKIFQNIKSLMVLQFIWLKERVLPLQEVQEDLQAQLQHHQILELVPQIWLLEQDQLIHSLEWDNQDNLIHTVEWEVCHQEEWEVCHQEEWEAWELAACLIQL